MRVSASPLSYEKTREAAVEYKPWTWKMPEKSEALQRNITRQDAYERISGYPMGAMNDYPPAQCLINESHLGYAAFGLERME